MPVFPVNTGGATGATLPHVASQLVRGGAFSRVLCLGPPTFDGVSDFQAHLNTIFGAFGPPLGTGPVHVGAAFAAAYQQRHAACDEDFARVAVKARAGAHANPFAHLRKKVSADDVMATPIVASPLRVGMICPISSTATALVVTSKESARDLRNPPVSIRAIGSTADTFQEAGRRDLAGLHALAVLSSRVFRQAGVEEPRRDLDVAELFSPYAPFELMQYDALGLCPSGGAPDLLRSGATEIGGDIPVNPSGGPLCTNSGVASELAPFGYVALQLMGQAAGAQVPGARRGVAHSMGSALFMCNTVGVLQANGDAAPN
jgi:acetyl-CoA C-acetyltransferase